MKDLLKIGELPDATAFGMETMVIPLMWYKDYGHINYFYYINNEKKQESFFQATIVRNGTFTTSNMPYNLDVNTPFWKEILIDAAFCFLVEKLTSGEIKRKQVDAVLNAHFYLKEFDDIKFEEMKRDLKNGDDIKNFYGHIFCGEVCVDVGGENGYICLSMYAGGVDANLYGFSTRPAMDTGKYKRNEDVPEKDLYPYDYVSSYCQFNTIKLLNMTYDEFINIVEKETMKQVLHNQTKYAYANLIEKMTAPLVIF